MWINNINVNVAFLTKPKKGKSLFFISTTSLSPQISYIIQIISFIANKIIPFSTPVQNKTTKKYEKNQYFGHTLFHHAKFVIWLFLIQITKINQLWKIRNKFFSKQKWKWQIEIDNEFWALVLKRKKSLKNLKIFKKNLNTFLFLLSI